MYSSRKWESISKTFIRISCCRSDLKRGHAALRGGIANLSVLTKPPLMAGGGTWRPADNACWPAASSTRTSGRRVKSWVVAGGPASPMSLQSLTVVCDEFHDALVVLRTDVGARRPSLRLRGGGGSVLRHQRDLRPAHDDGARLVDDVLGRAIDFRDQLLQLIALNRRHFERRLHRLLEELGILHRVVEGLAQGRRSVRWDIRRRKERASQRRPRENHPQHVALLVQIGR